MVSLYRYIDAMLRYNTLQKHMRNHKVKDSSSLLTVNSELYRLEAVYFRNKFISEVMMLFYILHAGFAY
jgi:hypothetical protein